jgi:hypothetical protein
LLGLGDRFVAHPGVRRRAEAPPVQPFPVHARRHRKAAGIDVDFDLAVIVGTGAQRHLFRDVLAALVVRAADRIHARLRAIHRERKRGPQIEIRRTVVIVCRSGPRRADGDRERDHEHFLELDSHMTSLHSLPSLY